MSITIRLKRGTRSQIDSATLQIGEPAFAIDTNELVIQGTSSKITIGKNADTVDNYHIDATGATTGQLVQFDTANVKLSAAPIYNVSGNVGIGITSPTQKLHTAGNIGIQAGANAFIGTVDNYALSLRTNNTDRIFVTSSGNVGIGTASPQTNLHVNSSGSTTVRVDAPGSQQVGYQLAKDGSVKWSAYIDVNSNDLRFWDGTTDRVIFANGGNVGIGVAPSYKLHVAGSIGIQAGANAFIGTVDNYNLSIRTNNTDRVVMDTSGVITFQGTAGSQPKLRISTVSTSSYAFAGLDWFINGAWIGGFYLEQDNNNIFILQTAGGSRRPVAIFPYSTSTAEGQLVMIVPDPVHGAYKSDFPSGWYGGLGTQNLTCGGVYYDALQQRSDANLKTDVQPLSDYLNTDCLDVISCLEPIKYVYADDPLKTNRFGFIAQDVSEVCPELVTVDTENKASLNYMDLIALLTKGIQELYNMITNITKVNTTQ